MKIIIWLLLFTSMTICNRSHQPVCMVDCTSLLTPHPPSLYEQYCCIPSNSGKKFKTRESNVVRFILCPNHLPFSCQKFSLNCSEVLKQNASAPSGYYTIMAPNGSLISVYCDMKGSNCNGEGGWMRVGYLNMSEPGAACPPGLTLRQFNNSVNDVCGRPMSSSVVYSAHGLHYSKVCGQIRGYQFGRPNGFPPLDIIEDPPAPNIENCSTYVDGVTVTYGNKPRKHIWTYACGVAEDLIPNMFSCPCNSNSIGTYAPSFVGSDYYCESGVPIYRGLPSDFTLYPDDPLWDGQQCNGSEGPCCINPKMPWFLKTLNETTTEDIELRVCGDEYPGDEDTPLDIIELYVR